MLVQHSASASHSYPGSSVLLTTCPTHTGAGSLGIGSSHPQIVAPPPGRDDTAGDATASNSPSVLLPKQRCVRRGGHLPVSACLRHPVRTGARFARWFPRDTRAAASWQRSSLHLIEKSHQIWPPGYAGKTRGPRWCDTRMLLLLRVLHQLPPIPITPGICSNFSVLAELCHAQPDIPGTVWPTLWCVGQN